MAGLAVEFIQCRNPSEVEGEAEAYCNRMNYEVGESLRSGFQKMSRRQEFRDFIQAVIRKVECDNLDSLTVEQRTTSTYVTGGGYLCTYPDQMITVAGISPRSYQLPSYFDNELDFTAFMYGLLEALKWTGGASIYTYKGQPPSNYYSIKELSLNFFEEYRYHKDKARGDCFSKSGREKYGWMDERASCRVFYCNAGLFTKGIGIEVSRYEDPHSPVRKGSLPYEITLHKKRTPPSDAPKEPKKSWY